MSSTAMRVRAIDVGYGNTKFTIDDEGTVQLFPSLAPAHRAQLENATGVLARRETTIVQVDGQEYEVGPDSVLFNETPVLHRDYIDTAEYRALVYGALHAMDLRCIDLLVLGLPVHLYMSRRARLQQIFTGRHMIQPGRIVEVRKVAVMAQPLGGYAAHHKGLDWSVHGHRTSLLVDPGFFSFDWMVTRHMKELPGLQGAVECGVSDCLRAIQEQLNEEYGEVYTNLRHLDECRRTGGAINIRGARVMVDMCSARVGTIVKRAVTALQNNVRDTPLDAIYLVGGGSCFFQEAIAAAFKGVEVETVDEPVTANVRGFHIVGSVVLAKANKVA